MDDRHPVHCIIPPYITERLAQSADPKIRARAIANLSRAAAFRAVRRLSQDMPALMVTMSPEKGKHRLVYDSRKTDQLPGTLVRSEGDKDVKDPAVNEAYDGAGATYDFYEQLFQRNSLDDRGMTLVSSVHVAEPDYGGAFVSMDNAFWNGEQMAYGDGDGTIFNRFTLSLDVIGHELTHGVTSFTSNLTYSWQSGALNEHFSDVFGILVRQWKKGESAAKADWTIGREVLIATKTRRAIRDMENPGTAFANDPDLGTDPQPAHLSKLYMGASDNGGVHINSGIPNRAFVLVAKALGGNAWDVAGRIWYRTLLQLSSSSQFKDCAAMTAEVAASFGPAAKKAVKGAWKGVGLEV
jgi:Zn-dependent metalloprotease